MKLKIAALMLAVAAFAPAAHAVPWCWKGEVKLVGSVHATPQYLQQTAFWMGYQINPTTIYTVSWHATHNLCQGYAGWTGPTYGVPGAGQVQASMTYWPTLQNQSPPYNLSPGAYANCYKCFPIPSDEPVPEDPIFEDDR